MTSSQGPRFIFRRDGARPVFARRSGRLKRQAGHALITTAIMLTAVIGFVGIATDTSYLEHVRRRAQNAADAAALAGAQQLAISDPFGCDSGNNFASLGGLTPQASAYNAADNDSSLNGFTSGSNNVTITKNCPAATGTYAGDRFAVEVVVQQTDLPTTFIGVLSGLKGTVSARAVAHLAAGSGCMVALADNAKLDPTNGISNSAALSLGCAITSNSTICDNGGGAITATSIGEVSTSAANGCAGGLSPAPTTGLLATADPLAKLFTAPAVSNCSSSCGLGTAASPYTGSMSLLKLSSGTTYLSPGTYINGIDIENGSTVYFSPGEYVMGGGGFTMNGGTASGTGGVQIYLTGSESLNSCPNCTTYGALSINGGALTLTAPSTPPAILFASDPTIGPCTGCTNLKNNQYSNNINGNGTLMLDGIVYMPYSGVSFGGTGNTGGNNIAIVSSSINIAGSATLGGNFAAMPGGGFRGLAVLGE